MCWRQFAVQWGDCKKSWIVPFSVIIIIIIINYYIIIIIVKVKCVHVVVQCSWCLWWSPPSAVFADAEDPEPCSQSLQQQMRVVWFLQTSRMGSQRTTVDCRKVISLDLSRQQGSCCTVLHVVIFFSFSIYLFIYFPFWAVMAENTEYCIGVAWYFENVPLFVMMLKCREWSSL